MTKDQANAIIQSVTGLPADHTLRLETAFNIANYLIDAVSTLDEDGKFCLDSDCTNQQHYELKA